jgi:glycosyltransferase involved in cell wall biosynthesis
MIVVNATALRFGGALTILSQFINSIENDENKYLVFIHPSLEFDKVSDNITLIKLDKTSFVSRILWDSVGLDKYLKKNSITADLIISLQNTSIRTTQPCKHLIYLHQAIPFSDYKWNIFKKSDFNFIIYKYFYAFFIFKYVTQETHFIVQATWLKNTLIDRGIKADKICIARPELNLLPNKSVKPDVFDNDCYSVFYPASSHDYKNHIELVKAVFYMKQHALDYKNIIFYFTFDLVKSMSLYKLICLYDLKDNFCFLGELSFDEVVGYYQSVNLVVFPSRLETFGLPLIEAATLGKAVVAIDLPYARDALNGYHGASYCKFNDSENWAKTILSLIQNIKFEPIPSVLNGWSSVHELINKLKVN